MLIQIYSHQWYPIPFIFHSQPESVSLIQKCTEQWELACIVLISCYAYLQCTIWIIAIFHMVNSEDSKLWKSQHGRDHDRLTKLGNRCLDLIEGISKNHSFWMERCGRACTSSCYFLPFVLCVWVFMNRQTAPVLKTSRWSHMCHRLQLSFFLSFFLTVSVNELQRSINVF